MHRIIEKDIILQSNNKKGIDRDLLLIQQSRELKSKLHNIKNETRNYELKLKKENKQARTKKGKLILRFLRNKYKEHYINKFNFLSKKQKDEIHFLNIKKKQKKN